MVSLVRIRRRLYLTIRKPGEMRWGWHKRWGQKEEKRSTKLCELRTTNSSPPPTRRVSEFTSNLFLYLGSFHLPLFLPRGCLSYAIIQVTTRSITDKHGIT